ncbi:13084_t:CDS:2, partial [Acaulospora morrowiae]
EVLAMNITENYHFIIRHCIISDGCLATSHLELVDSNSRDCQMVSQNETRKPGINMQPSSSSTSEKNMAGKGNKLKVVALMDFLK